MIRTEFKKEICKKYDIHLRIIYILGNRIMLQKQFIQLCILLNICENEYKAINILKELVEFELIKKVNFVDSSSKFIILKKYAIAYLQGKEKSTEVAAVRAINSNRKYYESIFKIHFIINSIIPNMKRNKIDEIDFKKLVNYISKMNCNILYKKNSGSRYYKQQLVKFKEYLNLNEVSNDIKILDEEYKFRIQNLNGIARVGDKKTRKNRKDYLETSNIETLIKKDIYIKFISKKEDSVKISLVMFDLDNTQKAANVALNVAIAYKLFKRLFKCKIQLFFNVAVFSEIAINNLKNNLSKKGINPRTRRPRIDNYFNETLRGDGLNELDFNNIRVLFSDYNIVENYQGKKILLT